MCGTTIEITVNGEKREFVEGVTVRELVEELKLVPQQVAVEVNRQLVPRGQHAGWCLKPGDCLEIVSLAGGG